MSVDSRNERDDVSLEWVEHQLRALSAVEPPRGLKEELLAAVPRRAAGEVLPWRIWRWPTAAGWAGLAAAIVLLCGILWIHSPRGPSVSPSADVNASLGQVLAADYNSVRPPDINALDSNGLY